MKLYNDKKWLKEQYKKHGTLAKLAELADCSNQHISRKMKEFGLAYKRQPNYKGGRTKNSDGYILILPPGKKQKGSTRYGYVYEHRYIMEQQLGRKLKLNEAVHHINGKPGDNRIENLCLVKSVKEHFAYHRGPRKRTVKNMDRVLELRKNGALVAEICKEVNLSKPTVAKILNEYDIVCYQCKKEFNSQKALGMHIVRIHRNKSKHTRAKEVLCFVHGEE